MADEIKQSKRGGKRANAGRKPKEPPNASADAIRDDTPTGPKEPHRWKPGQSGNPNGRPKIVGELRDLARERTAEALETLLSVMTNTEAPAAARVSAAAHILDRGYGKPQQSIVNTIRDARRLTDAELYAYIIETSGGEGIAAPERDTGLPN